MRRQSVGGDRVSEARRCMRRDTVMLHPLSDITYDMSGLASGDMCEYLHQYDMKRMPLCHFFAEGQCTKEDCQFLHIRPEDKIVECPWSTSSSTSPSLLLNLSLPPTHFFSGFYQCRSCSLEKYLYQFSSTSVTSACEVTRLRGVTHKAQHTLR